MSNLNMFSPVPPPPKRDGGLGKWQPTDQQDERVILERYRKQNEEIVVDVIKRFLDAVD